MYGISTYLDSYNLNDPYHNPNFKDYEDKIKFVEENNKLWNRIDVWGEAEEYFDWDTTHCVKYSGYLLNHTKKMAIDLADYYRKSKYATKYGWDTLIDALPVLTETGGGTPMAFFDGISVETTEELAGTWCGDLLQIVDDLPKDYQIINCCFAEIWSKVRDCYHKFGINKDNLILQDDNGKLLEVVSLNVYFKRGQSRYVKAEADDNGVKYSTFSK